MELSWRTRLERLFGTEELRESRPLQWLHGALLFGCFLSFLEWMREPFVSRTAYERGEHLCLPWFQDCGRWYFLSGLPESFSQRIFYAALLSIAAASAASAIRGRWLTAQLLMLPLFAWKVLMTMVLTAQTGCDFEYFHVPVMLVVLFCRHKLYFARIAFTTVYFLAATVKFHESWVVGTYFSSTELGLPLMPDVLIPFVTNFIILIEIVGPWLHFARDPRVRRWNLYFWVAFHAYSIILVGHKYPFFCLPVLLALFGSDAMPRRPGFARRTWLGWLTVAWLFGVQAVPWLIPGDIKQTLEGMKLGVGMFDANHQCEWTRTIHRRDGTSRARTESSREGMTRCDPYRVWYRLQQVCENENVMAVELRYLHSANGSPFYETVDVSNVCATRYRPFAHNTWIRTAEEGAPIAGYPRANSTRVDERIRRGGSIVFAEPDPALALSSTQRFFARYEKPITWFWGIAWLAMFVALLADLALRGRVLRRWSYDPPVEASATPPEGGDPR